MKLKTIRNPWSNPDQKPGNSLPTGGGWCAQVATRKTSRHSPRKAVKRRKHIMENFTKSSFLGQRRAAESRRVPTTRTLGYPLREAEKDRQFSLREIADP